MQRQGDKEIPKEFYSFDTGKLFSECMICGRDLLTSGVTYMIEKSIRRYPDLDASETIYDYAICMPCAVEQKKAMSEESLRRIEQYFTNGFQNGAAFIGDMTMEQRLEKCLIYGKPIGEMSEYVLQAACVGNKLSDSLPPFVIGQKAMNEISELLSAKTRDEIDGFIDRHFSGPPEFRELLRERKIVLI